jgi:uncharacterized membrane protein HdeD (DUF308 family)
MLFGVLTIVLGMLAMAAPLVSGLAVTTVVAILLIAAGIAQAIFAFKAGSFGQGALAFLFGLIAILGGAFIFARPLVGLASITMILAAYFFVDGFYGVVMSFRIRPMKGWGWMLIGSLASVLLGFMIMRQWPVSGAWAVGILVGVRLVLSGWSMIALGSVGEAAADDIEREAT